MDLKHIYKKSHAHNIFKNDNENKMLNHAYMLVCADKIITDEYAKFMACEVFCEQQDAPCFQCLNCTKILNGTHSDIAVFPEKERLTVEESRKITSDVFLAPFESKYKVYIIKNFDNATLQAQNALLKTLEEPSSFAIFILIASNINNVAITIKSRVKTVTERLLDIAEIHSIIKSKKPALNNEQMQLISMACNGNLSVANQFLENTNISSILTLANDILFKMQTTAHVLQYVNKTVALKKDIDKLLDQLLMLVNNYAIFLTNNNDTVINRQLKENFTNHAKHYNFTVLEKITRHINLAYKKLASHCAHTAVFDTLYISILEEKFLNKKQTN